MNQDRTMTPAQSCAKEIREALTAWAQAIGHVMPLPTTFDELNTVIIQRLLSSEVARVHGEYQKLAKEWRKSHEGHGDYPAHDDYACHCDECASAVEALAPNKEI